MPEPTVIKICTGDYVADAYYTCENSFRFDYGVLPIYAKLRTQSASFLDVVFHCLRLRPLRRFWRSMCQKASFRIKTEKCPKIGPNVPKRTKHILVKTLRVYSTLQGRHQESCRTTTQIGLLFEIRQKIILLRFDRQTGNSRYEGSIHQSMQPLIVDHHRQTIDNALRNRKSRSSRKAGLVWSTAAFYRQPAASSANRRLYCTIDCCNSLGELLVNSRTSIFVVSIVIDDLICRNHGITCEIKLFQNYFSLRRRLSEIISFQRVETCLRLFPNYFRGS